MKKILKGFLAFILALGMAGCSKKQTTRTTIKVESSLSMADMVENYVNAVDEQFSHELTLTLATDETYLSNDLGFRTAGSEAEHKAADYLSEVMEEIGLEVEKVPVTVDGWEFKDASLTISNTNISMMPASYAQSGTNGEIVATIVDCGTGFASDYEGIDVNGKIALVGVDQWNEAWIDQYMSEAYNHGAIAIVTYDIGGYGTYSDDIYNIQDVCCEDLLPTVCISHNQANQIIAAIEDGNDECNLDIDSTLYDDEGTSYNVVGKLKGKSSDQQIIVSGHYDLYFKAVQDDSSAIGTVLGIAKAMIDSGYEPENDILFIAHGSEEWGSSGTEFDWTAGAWKMITEAHPEWAEKTIAMINFELSAFDDGIDTGYISCVPEYASLVEDFVDESGLLVDSTDNVYADGFSDESVDSNTMEDGVSYRWAGVPYFINIPGTQDGEEGWIQQRYHSQADDESTYSSAVMNTNINTYGALAIYLDQMPAIQLDLTATVDDLRECVDEEVFNKANIDLNAYNEALDALEEAANSLNEKITDINTRYEEAAANNEDTTSIRQEGVALNKQLLSYFKYIQDHFVGIELSSTITTKHAEYMENVVLYDLIIADLQEGIVSNEEGTGALDVAWQLNGGSEYGYYNFSEKTNEMAHCRLLQEYNEGNMLWATDRGFKFSTTYPALYSIFEQMESEVPDYSYAITVYQNAENEQLSYLNESVNAEIIAMQELTTMINA